MEVGWNKGRLRTRLDVTMDPTRENPPRENERDKDTDESESSRRNHKTSLVMRELNPTLPLVICSHRTKARLGTIGVG